jgi:hypothetical protein
VGSIYSYIVSTDTQSSHIGKQLEVLLLKDEDDFNKRALRFCCRVSLRED